MSDWSPKENLVRECCFRIVRMYLNSEFNPSALHSSYFCDPTPQWPVVLYIVPETREFEQRTFQPELLCRGMQHPHRNTEGLRRECGWAKGDRGMVVRLGEIVPIDDHLCDRRRRVLRALERVRHWDGTRRRWSGIQLPRIRDDHWESG